MKNWLTKNKIYFEVFSSTLLGVMPIFISLAAYFQTKQQSKIASIQVSPQIRIDTSLLYDEEKQRYTDQIATLFNEGFPITNVRTHITSAYKISLMDGDKIKRYAY